MADWVMRRQAWTVAGLLAAAFHGKLPASRLRLALVLLVVPHLRLGDMAVLGLRPAAPTRQLRLRQGLRWLAGPRGTFDPAGCHPVLREGHVQVINLAARPGTRGQALRLCKTVLDWADRNRVELRADARLDDPRLEAAYRAYGFTSSPEALPETQAHLKSGVLAMRRPPSPTAGRRPADRGPPRTGRMTVSLFRETFGVPEPKVGDLILDIGAGDSPFVSTLNQRGVAAIAIDVDYTKSPPSQGGVALAAAASALPLRSAAATHAVMYFSLLHMTESPQSLSEALRTLAPGGALYVYPLWGRRISSELRSLPGVHIPSGPSVGRLGRWPIIVEANARDDIAWEGIVAISQAARPPDLIWGVANAIWNLNQRLTGSGRLRTRSGTTA